MDFDSDVVVGAGGRGGAGLTITEYTNNSSHTYSLPSGRNGCPGNNGRDGRNGLDGLSGSAGRFYYVVSSRLRNKPTLQFHTSLYNIKLRYIRFHGIASGIFEPGSTISLHDFEVENNGGMISPPHLEIYIDASSPANTCFHYSMFSFRTNLSVDRNQVGLITDSSHRLQFKLLDSMSFPLDVNQCLAFDTSFFIDAILYRTGYQFSDFRSIIPSYRFRIQYPVELSMISGPRSAVFNARIPWSFSITNKSLLSLGDLAIGFGRLLQVKIELVSSAETSSMITDKNLQFCIRVNGKYFKDRPLMLDHPIFLSIGHLGPGKELLLDGYLSLLEGSIPLYSSLHIQISLFLASIEDPMNHQSLVCIQRELYYIQMSEARKPDLSSEKEMILVINSDTEREDIMYWISLINSLGYSVNMWNVSLYNGISYNQPGYSIVESCPDSVIIFLNNPMGKTNSSEILDDFPPINFLEPAELFEAARRYGIRTYVVNEGNGKTTSYQVNGSGEDLMNNLFRLSIPSRPSPTSFSRDWFPEDEVESELETPEVTTEQDDLQSEDEDKKNEFDDYSEGPKPSEHENNSKTTAKNRSKEEIPLFLSKNEKGEEIFKNYKKFFKSLLHDERHLYRREEKLLPIDPSAYQYIIIRHIHVFTRPSEKKFHQQAHEFLQNVVEYRPDRSYFIKKNYQAAVKLKGSIFKRYGSGDIEVRRGLDHTVAMIAIRGVASKIQLGSSDQERLEFQREVDRFVVLKLFPLDRKLHFLTDLINRSVGDEQLEQQLFDTIISDIVDEFSVYFRHVNKMRMPWKSYNDKMKAKDIFTSLSALASFALNQEPSLKDHCMLSEDILMQKKVSIVQQIIVKVGLINRLYYKDNLIGNSLSPQILDYLTELFLLYCYTKPIQPADLQPTKSSIFFWSTKMSKEMKEGKKIVNELIDEELIVMKTILQSKSISIADILHIYQDPYYLQANQDSRHVSFNHWCTFQRQLEVDSFIIETNEEANIPCTLDILKHNLDDDFADGSTLHEKINQNSRELCYHPLPTPPSTDFLENSDRGSMKCSLSIENQWTFL